MEHVALRVFVELVISDLVVAQRAIGQHSRDPHNKLLGLADTVDSLFQITAFESVIESHTSNYRLVVRINGYE